MPKKNLAGVEVAAIVEELQFIVNGKISQIYHHGKELTLQLHARERGKQLLKIIPGKLLCLTDKKETVVNPSGFCMQLRKYLGNATVSKIYQHGAERIVVFELQKKEKYYIIIELFSKGNVVFTDAHLMIIGTLDRQIWKDRVVKPGVEYQFPNQGVNWKEITVERAKKIISTSEKKNVATTLATELSLGGVYAEEILLRAGVDKGKLPSEITDTEVGMIVEALHECIELLKTPKGYFYDEQITPLPLTDKKEERLTETYNEAINTLNPFEVVSPYEKKIATLQNRVKVQEGAITKLKEKIVVNTKKGEAVYEHYADLQKLLDGVSELRESQEWSEVAAELKKNSKIKGVDLKHKRVVIEL